MGVAVQLLGGVRATLDGHAVDIGGRRPGMLLAGLALADGRMVSTDRLIDLVWGDHPPATARRTMQSYIARLRRALGGHDAPLSAVGAGYVLAIERAAIDLFVFADAVTRAVADIDADPLAADGQLSRALEMWATPLDGLGPTLELEAAVAPYQELRLEALEALNDVEIDNGEAARAVGRLETLVREHPVRERFWAQLIQGLAALGRRDAALRAGQRARESLREWLGVEPSRTLQRVEQEVLADRRVAPNRGRGKRAAGGVLAASASWTEAGSTVSGATGVRHQRPRATRALLSTDLESSTARLDPLGDASVAALRRRHQILTEAISTFAGVEHGSDGASLFASFDSARDAVGAAVRAQSAMANEAWPEGATSRLGMGIHIGEVADTDEGLVGMAVHLGARIANAAHGGQILVSPAVAAVIDHLPDSISLLRLGRYLVRDIGFTDLFQVTAPGLDDRFPPPRGLRSLDGNVKPWPTALIGRDVELVEVAALLGLSRAVTLTGSGGVGKTRLAYEVAGQAVSQFDDGVWLIELAAIGDPVSIPAVVVSTLGLKHPPGSDAADVLIDILSDRSTMLVLDNCEHVLDAASALVERLQRACSRLVVLATSREPLRVTGETVYRVPSLKCPAPDASIEGIIESDAVQLMLERAGQRGVRVTNDDLQLRSIAAVCRRLDGMPLAIELAAARLPSMSVEDLLDQLSDQFRLLTGGSRSALPRHQTLRALIDWSYEALADVDRESLERLSVFCGGFVLDDALALLIRCGSTSWEAMDSITSLVDKSLLQAEASGSGMRYRLLETVRQYAAERLVERDADSAVAACDAHVNVFADLAASWVPRPFAIDDRHKRERVTAELENLRAAMFLALERPHLRDQCAMIARAYMRLWQRDGSLGDELRRVFEALVDDDSISSELRCDALLAAATLALGASVPLAMALLERAAAFAVSIGDATRERCVELYQAEACWVAGEIDAALRIVEETLTRAGAADESDVIAWGLELRAVLGMEVGGLSPTRDFEEALAYYDSIGDKVNCAVVLGTLAMADIAAGHFERALSRALDARDEIVEHAGGVGAASIEYYFVGLARTGLGELAAARDDFLIALEIDVRRGDLVRIAHDVMAAGLIASRAGSTEPAAKLHAAAAAIMERVGGQFQRFLREWLGTELAAVRERMGENLFVAASVAGRDMRRDDAVLLARSVLESYEPRGVVGFA